MWLCRRAEPVCFGILPEWSKGADLRSARRLSAWVQTPQVPSYAIARELVGLHTRDGDPCDHIDQDTARLRLCRFFLSSSWLTPLHSASKASRAYANDAVRRSLSVHRKYISLFCSFGWALQRKLSSFMHDRVAHPPSVCISSHAVIALPRRVSCVLLSFALVSLSATPISQRECLHGSGHLC